MRSLFVTGTDTDAGKTFVTAGIVHAFRRNNINAVPAKPVQTGCVNGYSSDLEFSLNLSGISLPSLQDFSPFVFPGECSPHLAAELAGRTIDVNDLAGVMERLSEENACVIAEGAGGILVPLGSGRTMLDLMRKLNWPVLLVSRDRLGMINHTLLSIQALSQAGLELAGVVVNHVEPPSRLISKSNVDAIREYGNVEILGEVPYSPDCFPVSSFMDIGERLMEILKK